MGRNTGKTKFGQIVSAFENISLQGSENKNLQFYFLFLSENSLHVPHTDDVHCSFLLADFQMHMIHLILMATSQSNGIL